MLWRLPRKGTSRRNRLSVVAPTSQGNKWTEQTKGCGAYLAKEQVDGTSKVLWRPPRKEKEEGTSKVLRRPPRKGTSGRNRLSVVAPTSQGKKRKEQAKCCGAHLARKKEEGTSKVLRRPPRKGTSGRNRQSVVAPILQGNKENKKYCSSDILIM